MPKSTHDFDEAMKEFRRWLREIPGCEMITIELKKGKCKSNGCSGTVGNLWPISLNDSDYVLIAYPCDKCGALHGNPEAREIIRDAIGNNTFYDHEKKCLVFKNKEGKVVHTDKSHIRAS